MARTKAHEQLQKDRAKAAADNLAKVPKAGKVPHVPKVGKVPKVTLSSGVVPTSTENEREESVHAQMEKDPNVRVIAVYNNMRNPYTGAMFNKGTPTDVVGLDSKDNAWTRRQIFAGVLAIYSPENEDNDSEENISESV